MPWTPTWGTGGDPQGINNSDDYAFPNRLNGPGCGSLVNPGNPYNYVKTQCFAIPTAPSQTFYNANCDSSVGNPLLLQCFNLRGNAGRNIIPGPGIKNLDFSLFKDFSVKRIAERFKIQFRAEVFNILNHPDFGDPGVSSGAADIFDATGAPIPTAGVLTTTTLDSREVQFALKVVW